MMIWQDFVVAGANILFVFSMIFQAYRGFKEKKGFVTLQTSGLTCLGLFALAISFFTLNLYISTAAALLNALVWIILFMQRIIYKKD